MFERIGSTKKEKEVDDMENAAAEAGRNNLAREMFVNAMNSGGPAYIQGYNPFDMATGPRAEQRYSALQMDKTGLNKLRNRATQGGPSAWANKMEAKSFLEEAAQRERAKREALSGAAQLQTGLAMRSGGLSSGAKERSLASANKDLLNMSQEAGREGAVNRMQIGISDEATKTNLLGQLPGVENQYFQSEFAKEKAIEDARQKDIERELAEKRAINQFNQNAYSTRMQGLAAQANAQAQRENSGK